MTTFIALYRGPTIKEAEIIAVSSDPNLVKFAAKAMLKQTDGKAQTDPALAALEGGRARALSLLSEEGAGNA